jgi:phytoene dehydrogenase-like protein
MSGYDVAVIGGGHNGLVAAGLLAGAGRRVVVLERRDRVGGVAELFPTAGRLRQSVIDSLRLRDHGLELVRPDVRMIALRDGQAPLVFHADAGRTAKGLRSLSAADADAYPRYDQHVRALSGFLARLNRMTPPRLDRPAAGDLVGGIRLGKAFRDLGPRTARELTRALPMAVADFVGEWFESDALRGALAARGTLATAMGPWSAGTALVLLNDMAEGGGGPAGETALVRGGPPALAGALRRAAEAAGAEIRTGEAVASIVSADGAVMGVELASGERVEAQAVASAIDPRTTLLDLVDPMAAGPRLRWRAGNIRAAGHVAVVELELSAPPAFDGVDDPALLAGRIVVARGLDELERAFDASKYGGASERPQIEAVITPPAGGGAGHRLHALVQWVSADIEPAAAGDLLVGELERHAPGIGGLVTGVTARTPSRLAEEYGLPGGHLLHAEPALDQFFAWRPVLGMARYRLPLRGLYLCGSGAHPGGGVTGGPGENAAREIARSSA